MQKDPVRGKTIQWTYEDGPLAGKTFEHDFRTDGTVTWRFADAKEKPVKPSGNGSTKGDGSTKQESTRYEVERVNADVFVVSYLAPSGYTLTSVLDENAGTIVSFASNEKELVVQHGTYEVKEPAARA